VFKKKRRKKIIFFFVVGLLNQRPKIEKLSRRGEEITVEILV